MFPLEKKKTQKTTTTTTKKVIKEPDAKCIYLFIHLVLPSSTYVPSPQGPVVLDAEGRGSSEGAMGGGKKKKKEKKKVGAGQRSWW